MKTSDCTRNRFIALPARFDQVNFRTPHLFFVFGSYESRWTILNLYSSIYRLSIENWSLFNMSLSYYVLRLAFYITLKSVGYMCNTACAFVHALSIVKDFSCSYSPHKSPSWWWHNHYTLWRLTASVTDDYGDHVRRNFQQCTRYPFSISSNLNRWCSFETGNIMCVEMWCYLLIRSDLREF